MPQIVTKIINVKNMFSNAESWASDAGADLADVEGDYNALVDAERDGTNAVVHSVNTHGYYNVTLIDGTVIDGLSWAHLEGFTYDGFDVDSLEFDVPEPSGSTLPTFSVEIPYTLTAVVHANDQADALAIVDGLTVVIDLSCKHPALICIDVTEMQSTTLPWYVNGEEVYRS